MAVCLTVLAAPLIRILYKTTEKLSNIEKALNLYLANEVRYVTILIFLDEKG